MEDVSINDLLVKDDCAKIPKSKFEELVQNKKYESMAIITIALRHYNKHRASTVILVDELMDYFQIATKQKQSRQAKIKQGIEDLGIELNGKSYANVDVPEINENYIMAHDHNINKILFSDIKSTVDRYKLITLYLAVMSHMGYHQPDTDRDRPLVTFVGHKKLAEETKLSANTVNAYLKILIEINVLMSNRICDTYYLPNNEIRSGHVYYTYISTNAYLNRYSEDKIKKYANAHKEKLLAKGCKLYKDGELITKDTIELNPIINAMAKETEYTEQVF